MDNQIKLFLEVKSHAVKMAANNIMLPMSQERKSIQVREETSSRTSGQVSVQSQVNTISEGSISGCNFSTEITSIIASMEEANGVTIWQAEVP